MNTATYYNQGAMNYDVYTTLYHTLVVPIMDYAAGVWGSKLYANCEMVQNKAIRTFLGVGKFTPLPSLNGDMGWVPFKVRLDTKLSV